MQSSDCRVQILDKESRVFARVVDYALNLQSKIFNLKSYFCILTSYF